MNEILILGAGYTGMAATVGLVGRLKARDDVHITLVNPQTRFTERLRLHQTASGESLADLQIPDQLEGTGVDFVKGWVTGIDADAQTVRIDDAYALRYDTLIYALGSVADTETVSGVDEFAYTLNSAQDATLLAGHLDRLADGIVVVAGEWAYRSRVRGRDRRAASRTRCRPAEPSGARIDDGRSARARLHADRGSGLGAELLDRLERHLRDIGVKDLVLGALPGNTDAIRLYERRGYRPTWLYLSRLDGRN